MQSEAVYRLGVSVDAGSGPGNLFVADPTMIVDNVDPLLPIIPQVVLLLEEVLLVDVFPKPEQKVLLQRMQVQVHRLYQGELVSLAIS